MYERFTDRARKVMQLANQEAQRLYHEYIGTEDVREELLNLLGQVGASDSSLSSVIPKPTEMNLSAFSPQTQEAVRELETEIITMCQAKQDAIAAQDFEKAALLRDKADRLKKI